MKITININKKTLNILKTMFRLFVITPATLMFIFAIFYTVFNGGVQTTIQEGFEYFTQLIVTQSLPMDQVTSKVMFSLFYAYLTLGVLGESFLAFFTPFYDEDFDSFLNQ